MNRFLPIFLNFILVISYLNSISFAMTEGFLSEVPRDFAELSAVKAKDSIKIVMAKNETEIVFLRLKGIGQIILGFPDKEPMSGVDFELFEVFSVPIELDELGGRTQYYYDPMISLDNGLLKSQDNATRLVVIKIKALKTAKTGGRSFKVVFKREGATDLSLDVDLEIKHVVVSDLADPILQAAVWAPGKRYASNYEIRPSQSDEKDNIIELIKFLRNYHFNALSRLWERYNNSKVTLDEKHIETYKEIVNLALNDLGYRLIRLPNPSFFRGERPFKEIYKFNQYGLDRWKKDINKSLAQFDDFVNDPKWKNSFSYEIWDEPWKNQISQVNLLYKTFGEKFPNILRQLTREPYFVEELQDVADIWVIGMKRFDGREVKKIQERGDKVWLYANHWHGLDRRPTDMRAIGWVLWQYGLDGYFLWGVNRWKSDPWTTITNKKNNHFKRATLVYPHPETGETLPSLRLEFFREGIEDLMLLTALKIKNDEKFHHIFQEIRPRYEDSLPDFKKYHDDLLERVPY